MKGRKKKVLVTGASGFLGSHISEAAHEAGYEVHALIRETSSRQWLDHDWLTVHVCELDDRKTLARILKGADAVIHNAGALPGSSEAELRRTNVESTRILAEEAIKADVRGFVYASSRSAGGVNTGGLLKTEDEPDSSTVSYGKSKKQAEEILYSLRKKIHAVSLRYSLIYGPRDRHLLRLFKIVNGSIVPIPGFKPIYTPMVYVEDAARAAIAALQAPVDSGSFYYISDGVEYTLDLMYDFITQALGKSGVRVRIPLWVASVAAWWMNGVMRKETGLSPDSVRDLRSRYRLVSPKRAIRELGWMPEVTPQQGFAETVRWYRDQGWL